MTRAPCSTALGGGNSPGLFSEYSPIVSKSMPQNIFLSLPINIVIHVTYRLSDDKQMYIICLVTANVVDGSDGIESA